MLRLMPFFKTYGINGSVDFWNPKYFQKKKEQGDFKYKRFQKYALYNNVR
jgi:hypothetical protein